MTAVTAVQQLSDSSTTTEVIKFTAAASADTYSSKKFGTLIGGHVSPVSFAIAETDAFSVTVSGKTATFTLVGTTTGDFIATLYGLN
jgi:hypothetical protein